MSMKTILLVAIAFVGSACITDQPLLVTRISSLDPDRKGLCMASPDLGISHGSLDLAGGGTYLLEFGITNDLDNQGGEQTLETGVHRNTVNLDTVTYTYTSVPAITFAQESTPIAFILPPTGLQQGKSFIRSSIFNRKALETLLGELPGTNANGVVDVREVKVKVVFSGSVVSGGRISSVPVSFPVTVYNSGFTCPTPGDSLGAMGPCGTPGGQDGSRVCCASDVSCTFAK
jgi:hypothetical protein